MPLLSAEEAYRAAQEDFAIATQHARYAIDHKMADPDDYDRIIVGQLEILMQARIDRGELAPFEVITEKTLAGQV